MRRSLSAPLATLLRTISARWQRCCAPSAPAGRLLSQRRRLWSGFALHLCCWCLGAAEAWVIFRLLGVDLTSLQALAASFARRARDLALGVGTLGLAAVCDANFAFRPTERRSG
jgi:hypothetical protein